MLQRLALYLALHSLAEQVLAAREYAAYDNKPGFKMSISTASPRLQHLAATPVYICRDLVSASAASAMVFAVTPDSDWTLGHFCRRAALDLLERHIAAELGYAAATAKPFKAARFAVSDRAERRHADMPPFPGHIVCSGINPAV